MVWSLSTNPSTAISNKCLMPHSLNISFWVVSPPNAALKVKDLIWPKLLSICKNRWRKKTPDSSEITKNHYYEMWKLMRITTKFYQFMVQACVAERLTPRTSDLEVQGSSLARCVVFLDKELWSTLSLFIQVYQWVLYSPRNDPDPEMIPTLKWSPNWPRNDPNPEMIPIFLLVDPEMIPKEL